MHHHMDYGRTGMGLQESIGNGIATNLVWEGESCYKAKSSKTKARRQQEELRWEWQVSSSVTQHTANESKALRESRAEGSRQVFRRAVASIWEHIGFHGSPPETAVMYLVAGLWLDKAPQLQPCSPGEVRSAV